MRRYWWSLPIGLAWPVTHVLAFFLRFPEHFGPETVLESWVFVPFGLLSGVGLVALFSRASTRVGQAAVVSGYLLLSPIAFIGSLGGGLMFHPALGALLYGGLPLLIGMGMGYGIGVLYENFAIRSN